MASQCIGGAYSGRPAFSLVMCMSTYAVDVPNNRSSYSWSIRAEGSGGSFALDCFTWNVAVNGQGWSGCHSLDFRGGSPIEIASGTTNWIGHDAAGNAGINGSANHLNASIFGSAYVSNNMWADRIARPPGQPRLVSVSNVSSTNFAVTFSLPENNGGAIDAFVATWRDSANNTIWQDITGGGNPGDYRYTEPATRGGPALTPGETYTVILQARNSAGYGPALYVTQQTIPATPPGVSVAPSISGQSAVVSLTPPSGTSGVAFYGVRYRPMGSTGNGTQVTGQSPITITGLTPGQVYEWSGIAAFSSTIFSPYSDWVAYQQPNPNTNPGDYFDGSTADSADVDFRWDGTVNKSASRAVGLHPTGWADFAQAAATSGGTGVAYRVTGAIARYPGGQAAGTHSARYAFFSDAVAAGFRAGTDDALTAEVSEGGVYYGSIAVQPSRSQRLAAEISWYDSLGVLLSRTVGNPQVVAPGEPVRLSASGTAPDDGYATVEAIDVTGTGWSVWLGGETITVDGAIVTIGAPIGYFDGDTPDTAQYIYAWTEGANASPSTRTTVAVVEDDPLADPDCPPPPSPPQPPQITDDCITEVGTWRRYWLQVPAGEISQWLATIPTHTLTTGAQAAREVRIRVWENPDGLPPQQFIPTTDWVGEQIVRYIPPATSLVIDGVSERARASVGGDDWIAADHLLYGTGGAPATWPLLQCGLGYLIALDVPLDAALGNLTADLALTRRML
jgi:hypothetical protein